MSFASVVSEVHQYSRSRPSRAFAKDAAYAGATKRHSEQIGNIASTRAQLEKLLVVLDLSTDEHQRLRDSLK